MGLKTPNNNPFAKVNLNNIAEAGVFGDGTYIFQIKRPEVKTDTKNNVKLELKLQTKIDGKLREVLTTVPINEEMGWLLKSLCRAVDLIDDSGNNLATGADDFADRFVEADVKQVLYKEKQYMNIVGQFRTPNWDMIDDDGEKKDAFAEDDSAE